MVNLKYIFKILFLYLFIGAMSKYYKKKCFRHVIEDEGVSLCQ